MAKSDKAIRVTVKGSETMELGDLLELQGKLKESDPIKEGKLRQSILDHGFAVPFVVWRKEIMDGHRRRVVLKRLRDRDGYTVPPLPVCGSKLKTRAEAAEMVLQINSQYGTITDGGLAAFIAEHELGEDVLAKVELPGVGVLDAPDAEETEAQIEQMTVQPAPAMVWVLVGIAARDYARITTPLQAVADMPGVIYESTIR